MLRHLANIAGIFNFFIACNLCKKHFHIVHNISYTYFLIVHFHLSRLNFCKVKDIVDQGKQIIPCIRDHTCIFDLIFRKIGSFVIF